jgi:hypothetical protein
MPPLLLPTPLFRDPRERDGEDRERRGLARRAAHAGRARPDEPPEELAGFEGSLPDIYQSLSEAAGSLGGAQERLAWTSAQPIRAPLCTPSAVQSTGVGCPPVRTPSPPVRPAGPNAQPAGPTRRSERPARRSERPARRSDCPARRSDPPVRTPSPPVRTPEIGKRARRRGRTRRRGPERRTREWSSSSLVAVSRPASSSLAAPSPSPGLFLSPLPRLAPPARAPFIPPPGSSAGQTGEGATSLEERWKCSLGLLRSLPPRGAIQGQTGGRARHFPGGMEVVFLEEEKLRDFRPGRLAPARPRSLRPGGPLPLPPGLARALVPARQLALLAGLALLSPRGD